MHFKKALSADTTSGQKSQKTTNRI